MMLASNMFPLAAAMMRRRHATQSQHGPERHKTQDERREEGQDHDNAWIERAPENWTGTGRVRREKVVRREENLRPAPITALGGRLEIIREVLVDGRE